MSLLDLIFFIRIEIYNSHNSRIIRWKRGGAEVEESHCYGKERKEGRKGRKERERERK